METRLNEILKSINDWLKYAETKSATLLAANGVAIWGILRLINSVENINYLVHAYLILAVGLLSVSTIFIFIAFSPSLEIPWFFKNNNPSKTDNLLFFEHIAKYTPQKYLESLSISVADDIGKTNEFDLMLVKQIIANSIVARRKYKIFNISIWFTISAFITPFLALLLIKRVH